MEAKQRQRDGFIVQRKEGVGGHWDEIRRVPVSSTSYSDTDLSPRTTYYYRVRAYNSDGESLFTNEATAATLPPGVPHTRTAVLLGRPLWLRRGRHLARLPSLYLRRLGSVRHLSGLPSLQLLFPLRLLLLLPRLLRPRNPFLLQL